MALIAGLSLKTIATAGSTALVVGGGGTAAIIYRESIVDFIKHGSSGNREAKQFDYIVATVSALDNASTDSLYSSDHKTLKCAITIADNTTTDRACSIYKLNKARSPDSIAFQDVSTSMKIQSKSDLTTDKQILVKVSSAFKAKLSTDQSAFQLLTNKGEKVADLKWEFDLNKNQDNSNTAITESSLLVIKLNGGSAANFSSGNTAGNSYKCHIGSDTTGIDCKVYKPYSETSPHTHESLKTLTAIGSSDSSLAAGTFLVIDLLETKKSFADLDNQQIVIKHSSTEMAKGIIDNLLIGKIGATGTNSMLFKVSDDDARRTVTLSGNKNHILTKFAAKHIDALTTITADKLICRVVDETTIYQDETCDIYKFGDASKTTFDLADLTADQQKIAVDTDITTDKYQVVKVDQSIIDKLNISSTSPKKLEIIQKDKKGKAFNNQYLSLDVKGLFSSGSSTTTTLHSNLFAARVKTAPTDTTSTTLDNLKCTIDGVELDCKIYKPDTEPTGNSITHTNLTGITSTLTPSTHLAVNKYAVVELTSSQKTLNDLKNKTIVVKKSDNSELVTLEFDQQLFGYTDTGTKYVVPLKAKEVSFIVAKGTKPSDATWSSDNIAETARCKFAKTDGSINLDNYDYSCKLMKFTTLSDNKTISALTDLKELKSPSGSSLVLDSDTEGFYKLTFDANKLYNIDLEVFADNAISIELAPTAPSGANTVYGVVQLKHDITAEEAKGKTAFVAGKVTTPATGTANLTGGKCYFDTETTAELECTVYKNSASPKTELNKGNFSTAASASETLTAGEFFLFKLNNEKSISELKGKTQINYKQTGSSSATTMNIEAILGGDEANGKKLYVLHPKTTA